MSDDGDFHLLECFMRNLQLYWAMIISSECGFMPTLSGNVAVMYCEVTNCFMEVLSRVNVQVPTFQEQHGLVPCMVAPTKIIAGLGLSLGIDILDAPGATGDYRTLLTSKATAIASALSAPSKSPPSIFIPGDEGFKPGHSQGYDFGFLHIKVT